MRAHQLLSPHRVRQGPADVHDRTIITTAPGAMWATDGAKVFTLEDGWVWTFVAVEHWNAECVGWHVAKHGDRYAALEPLARGVTQYYGGVEADVARGLAVRLDHGTQYLSDHFVNQLRFWVSRPALPSWRSPKPTGSPNGSSGP
jgi:putative transposase